jgi:hypothetical protein
MKIKIVATPPGFAPEDIRKRWVGIVMPTLGKECSREANAGHRLGRQNLGGYKVRGSDAMQCLKTHDPIAYEYWEQFCLEDTVLIFKADVCEEVTD